MAQRKYQNITDERLILELFHMITHDDDIKQEWADLVAEYLVLISRPVTIDTSSVILPDDFFVSQADITVLHDNQED